MAYGITISKEHFAAVAAGIGIKNSTFADKSGYTLNFSRLPIPNMIFS
jgi:hypothetical protein